MTTTTQAEMETGYQTIIICRPEEVVDYDDESEDE
jgi:hypothetical protein